MSRYSVLPEGDKPGGDIVFRHQAVGWALYVGDSLFGQVFRMRRGSWTAVSHGSESAHFKTRMMPGFGSRFDAGRFIIYHHGYWLREILDPSQDMP